MYTAGMIDAHEALSATREASSKAQTPRSPGSGRNTPALCTLRSVLVDHRGQDRTCLDNLIETADTPDAGRLDAGAAKEKRTLGFTPIALPIEGRGSTAALCPCQALSAVLGAFAAADEYGAETSYLSGFVGIGKELPLKKPARASCVSMTSVGDDAPTRRSSRRSRRESDTESTQAALRSPHTLCFSCTRLECVAELLGDESHVRQLLDVRDELAAPESKGRVSLVSSRASLPDVAFTAPVAAVPQAPNATSPVVLSMLRSAEHTALFPALSILGTCYAQTPEVAAACTIQRAWRCRRAREERRHRADSIVAKREMDEARDEAASVIQHHWRLSEARRKAKKRGRGVTSG
eukprot:TRINITY_DN3232_c0_g1_i12.p2 TRINITY_DN3232_c0_g1~~TRINITY_DN3232_c0_g1_i12.p2  ORF type:complete len:351 (+),score=78.67 TRINITY_DN3232_c0_g1_i12:812-1864(+)